jgi:hypothetical protein
MAEHPASLASWRTGSGTRGHRRSDHRSDEREDVMARYGPKARKTVESAMKRRKKGTLRSGRSGRKVTSRKQAIAIGLSEARQKGAKVPRKRRAASRKKK